MPKQTRGGGKSASAGSGKKAAPAKKSRSRGSGKVKAKRTEAADSTAKERLNLIVRAKFQAGPGRKPTDLEKEICQYLVEMESSDQASKTFKSLRALGIVSAYPYAITESKKAILIFVPFRQHKEWKKIQERVQGELQKKFSGQDIVFLAQRKVIKLNVCDLSQCANSRNGVAFFQPFLFGDFDATANPKQRAAPAQPNHHGRARGSVGGLGLPD